MAIALKHNPMHSSSSKIFLNISIDEVCMYIMTSFYAITSFAMMSNLTFFFKTRDFTKLIQKNCILYNLFFLKAKAYRNCTGNGTWLFIPELNSTWSDYRACVIINPGITVVPKLIEVRNISFDYTLDIGWLVRWNYYKTDVLLI